MQYVNTLMLSIVTGMMIQIGREGTVKQPKKRHKKNPNFFSFYVQLDARSISPITFPHGYSANFGIISGKQNKETCAYENIQAYQIIAYIRRTYKC